MSTTSDVVGGSPSRELSRERSRQAEMYKRSLYQDEQGSEGISLLKPDAPPTIDEEIAERRLGMFFWILIIVGFSGFVAFWGWDREIVQIITRYFASRESTTTADLYIMAFNEYGSFSAPYSWLDTVSGSQIVEPYKETTLSLNGAYASGSTFKWALAYPSEDEPSTWTGSDAKEVLTLTEPGSYSITVEAFDVKTGSFRGRYTTLLMVKYVRREIRSLTDADRARFSQAAKLMWNTSTDEGVIFYSSLSFSPSSSPSPLVPSPLTKHQAESCLGPTLRPSPPSPTCISTTATSIAVTLITTAAAGSRTTLHSPTASKHPCKPSTLPCPFRTGTSPLRGRPSLTRERVQIT